MTPIADDPAAVDDDESARANLANWEERVDVHVGSAAYEVDALASDPARLSAVVRDDAATLARAAGRDPHAARPLAGLDLLHLQCHIGTDTLSLARLGATVTGVDFSPAALMAARELFARAGTPGTFVESDVTRAADAVPGTFDVVYTSIGTTTWFRDLTAWADGIARLLRPGGVFVIRDAHPTAYGLDDERDDGAYVLRYRTMPNGRPEAWDDGTTYTGDDATITSARTYDWPHSLSEIVTALLDAGLRITGLAEGTTLPWRPIPGLVEVAPGTFALPERDRDLFPLSYTITARSPADTGDTAETGD